MFNKLLGTLQRFGIIFITLLIGSAAKVNAQEYVFSAPSEVDREQLEVPHSDKDYPLYECEQDEQSDVEKRDSHNCECLDCAETSQESAEEKKLTSQNQQNKQ